MAKWKKKLRKFAKKAIPAIGLGLAATALAKNRNRDAMIKGADANEGFGAMTLKDYGPHTIGGGHVPQVRTDTVLASPRWKHWDANYMAKGGRVRGAGKAKRGLGRAFTKSKK